MNILTYYVRFSSIACRYFSKWRPIVSPKGVSPIYFRQNDRKGCRSDYLDGFGHFVFGFGAAEKNSRGRGNDPLGKATVTGQIIS